MIIFALGGRKPVDKAMPTETINARTTNLAPSITYTLETVPLPTNTPTATLEPTATPLPDPSYHVSTNGNDANDGRTKDNAFTSIQKAIQSASAGDVVYVHAGTYQENIIVDKAIFLIGENPETTIIQGSKTGDVVTISSNDVLLSSFSIIDSGTAYISPFDGGDAAVKLEHVQNVIVSNIYVTDSTLGIFLNYSDHNTLEKNTTLKNFYEGVYLRYSNNNLVQKSTSNQNGGHGGYYVVNGSENHIVNNVCDDNPDHGIKLQRQSNNNLVEYNRCTGNVQSGIFLVDSYHNIIRNNDFIKNCAGAFIRLSDFNLIEENNFHENENGITLDFASFENIIRNNTTTNNWGGISIRYSSNRNLITGNTVTSNNSPGIEIKYSSENEVSKNLITENGEGLTFVCGDPIHIAPDVESVTWEQFNKMEGYFEKFREFVFDKGIVFSGKDCAGNKIFENVIENNVNWGMVSSDSQFGYCQTEIEATNNWWGEPSGPYHPELHPSGQGMVISNGILYDPWLSSPPELPCSIIMAW